MKYNHKRPLSDFDKSIELLKSHGYNPIAVTQMYMENTFVFETSEEATKAFNEFEKNSKRLIGWWYGKSDFLDAVQEYETDNNGYSKVLIYWLNN